MSFAAKQTNRWSLYSVIVINQSFQTWAVWVEISSCLFNLKCNIQSSITHQSFQVSPSSTQNIWGLFSSVWTQTLIIHQTPAVENGWSTSKSLRSAPGYLGEVCRLHSSSRLLSDIITSFVAPSFIWRGSCQTGVFAYSLISASLLWSHSPCWDIFNTQVFMKSSVCLSRSVFLPFLFCPAIVRRDYTSQVCLLTHTRIISWLFLLLSAEM